MPEFSSAILAVARDVRVSAFAGSRRAAPDQGGLLSGKDPSAFNTADPLRLWIIQVGASPRAPPPHSPSHACILRPIRQGSSS
jgi:hypothetical protein